MRYPNPPAPFPPSLTAFAGKGEGSNLDSPPSLSHVARRIREGGVRWLFLLLLLCGCGKSDAPKPPSGGAKIDAPPATNAGIFAEVSAQAGINFTLGHGGRSPLTILETLGNGCGFFDYDGDGWLDILLVAPNKVALYHNNRNGTFTDVTGQSGLKQQGEWQGVATGDYDNDGKVDLYISGYRCGALYHNEGNGKFRDVTKQAGLESKLWGTSACFVDVDNDGFLDLYVANYVKFYSSSMKFCKFNNVDSTCGPTNYDPERGTFYHNNSNGTFTDETVKRGLATAHGNALGIAIADYDGDGWVDIAVANDQLPGDLFHNKGKGYFENVGLSSGTAYDVNGNAHAGMGIDWADYDADNRLELIVTTYQHQPDSLYTQKAPGLFTDTCYTAGIAQPTVNYVGFGIKFLDYDNDGMGDVLIANGHAVDNIAKTDSTTTYPQPIQLFHNVGGGKLQEVTAQAGPDFQHPIVGRGLAVGDFDNDGRMDALIVNLEGHVLLLHNETGRPPSSSLSNHWLAVKLVGTRSNRDGIGAHITLESGGRKIQAVVTSGGSFMSASDLRVHFGLGSATKADRLTVRWPSGQRTVLKNVAGDRTLTLTEEARASLRAASR